VVRRNGEVHSGENMKKKTFTIKIDDALNADWLHNLRRMKKMNKKLRQRFIRKMEKIKLVSFSWRDQKQLLKELEED